MSAAHSWYQDEKRPHIIRQVGPAKVRVATAEKTPFDRAADIAARGALIAAAPDLLAALCDCADYMQLIPEPAAGGDDESLRLFKAAAKAIAKATGRK